MDGMAGMPSLGRSWRKLGLDVNNMSNGMPLIGRFPWEGPDRAALI